MEKKINESVAKSFEEFVHLLKLKAFLHKKLFLSLVIFNRISVFTAKLIESFFLRLKALHD